MNTRRFAILAFLAVGLAGAGLLACSSDDSSSNPTPTPRTDSGTPNTPDATVPGDKDSGPSTTDSGPGIDAALPDAGGCTSDSSTCNSCFTPQQDPVNGCSPAAANCIPFTKVVPTAP